MHYFGEFGTPYPYVRISSHKDCATGATVCKQSDTPHLPLTPHLHSSFQTAWPSGAVQVALDVVTKLFK